MPRHKDEVWSLPDGTPNNAGGHNHNYETIQSALLMDLRDELKSLNALLHCSNFIAIPEKLNRIIANTTKKKNPRRTKK